MFETFRRIRSNMLLVAISSIAVGALLLVFPDTFFRIACYVIGGVMVGYGCLGILGCVRDHVMRLSAVFVSIIAIGFGVFVISQPVTIGSVFPFMIGLLLVLDGALNSWHGIVLHHHKYSGWLPILFLGIITVVIGGIMLFHPYSTAKMTFRLIAAALLYNGISDLIILIRMSFAAHDYRDKHAVIDVESHPIYGDSDDD